MFTSEQPHHSQALFSILISACTTLAKNTFALNGKPDCFRRFFRNMLIWTEVSLMRCSIRSVNSTVRTVRALYNPYKPNEPNLRLTDRYNAGVLDKGGFHNDFTSFIASVHWLINLKAHEFLKWCWWQCPSNIWLLICSPRAYRVLSLLWNYHGMSTENIQERIITLIIIIKLVFPFYWFDILYILFKFVFHRGSFDDLPNQVNKKKTECCLLLGDIWLSYFSILLH